MPNQPVPKHVQCEGTNLPTNGMKEVEVKSNYRQNSMLEGVKCSKCGQHIRVVVDSAKVKRVAAHRRPVRTVDD